MITTTVGVFPTVLPSKKFSSKKVSRKYQRFFNEYVHIQTSGFMSLRSLSSSCLFLVRSRRRQ
uniref:Uncharacterized protein n=1 Tax=Arundo donax TaxID=35708 RepID=A0A0A9E4D7_ARUDO